MGDTGQAIAAEPVTPGPLCSITDLNGYDFHEIRKAIGMPLMAAIDNSDEQGFYAYVWRAEMKRDGNKDLKFADVQQRPFGEIMAAFTENNEDGGSDPTSAGSGNA